MKNSTETAQKEGFLPSKVLSLRRDSRESPYQVLPRITRVKGLKDAKKLMSRLLVAFQRGEIEGQDAKTMAYLLSTFVQVVKDAELEGRIQSLEERLG